MLMIWCHCKKDYQQLLAQHEFLQVKLIGGSEVQAFLPKPQRSEIRLSHKEVYIST